MVSGFQCCVHGFMLTQVNSTRIKVSNTLQLVCQQTESYCGSLFISANIRWLIPAHDQLKVVILYSQITSLNTGYKCNDRNMWQHKWEVSTHADHEQRSEWRPVYCCSQHPASYIHIIEATHLATTNTNEYKSSRATNCSNS